MSDSQPERLRGREEVERISELLRRFIENLRSHGRSEQTTRSYSGDLKLFARWFYETNREELTPQSITPIDLREYKRYLLEDRGLKPATVNRRLASISAFCKWAQEQGLADGNPCDEISIVPEVRPAPKSLTKREQYSLIRAVQKANRPRDEALIMLMLHTGLRVSEVSSLRIRDISISSRKGEVMVRGGKYRRVSTEEQAEGYSLEAQDRAIDGFLAQKREAEWEVISMRDYVAEGASARTEDLSKRPAFKQMMDDALSGRLDVIIVHKLDRFSRNLLVTLTYFQKLSQAGVAFVSVSEQMDFSTPIGRMMLAVLGAVAQWYSDNLSQETKKGKQKRAYQGLYNGCLPFGYVKGEDGIPVVVEEEAEAIRLAFDRYATGKYSLNQIATLLNSKGYRTRARGKKPSRLWSGDTLRYTLKNRFYLGFTKYKDKVIPGKHEAIIDKELFDRCQKVRAKRTKAPRAHSTGFRPYLLSGPLRCCRCRDLLRAQPNRLRLTYYREASSLKGKRCPASPLLVRTEYFDLQVDRIIRGLTLPTSWQIRVMQIVGSQDERQKALRERERLRERLRRLNKQYRYLEVEEEEYQREKREKEKSSLRESILSRWPIPGMLPRPRSGGRCFASCSLAYMPIRPPEE